MIQTRKLKDYLNVHVKLNLANFKYSMEIRHVKQRKFKYFEFPKTSDYVATEPIRIEKK